MPLIDCKCGKPVRLGAIKLTVNRRKGISHYITHMDGSLCRELNLMEWQVSMLKPYPKNLEDKPYWLMMQRWGMKDEA